DTVRIPPVSFQPIASDDVARAVSKVAEEAPVNGTVEVGGPERFREDEFFRDALAAWNDPREVVTDPHARYYGAELSERSLVQGDAAMGGRIGYRDWPGRPPTGK